MNHIYVNLLTHAWHLLQCPTRVTRVTHKVYFFWVPMAPWVPHALRGTALWRTMEPPLRHIHSRSLPLQSADKLPNMSSCIQNTTYF